MSFFGIVRCFLVLALAWMGSAGAAVESEYLLGAGDVVRVSVFQNPDLTVETRVSEAGGITYPLLGSVPVGGLSINGAERKIAELLRSGGFVLQPQVNILLLQIRGNQVAVLGQVNRPGRFPLETANSKVSDLLALAGGMTPLGSDTVILTGIRAGKPVRLEIDVPSMFLDGHQDKDIVVQGGDMLYVHRAPQFYIYGEVQRPGAYRLERDMTVMQALAQGGGVTQRGTQWGLRINRRAKDGSTQRINPEMDERVQADDVLYIRESIF